MNRRVALVAVALAAGFAVLLVQLTNLGYVSAGGLRSHELNTRAAAAAVGAPRGTITSVDGEVIASNIWAPVGGANDTDGGDGGAGETGDASEAGRAIVRDYTHGSLYAHVAGYISAVAGADGVERSYDDELSGKATSVSLLELADLFVDSDRVGNLGLTLHHGVQLTARAALGDRDGAVVVLDPSTGELIAMWSRPAFNPNALVALGRSQEAGQADPNAAATIARAYRRHYVLGSGDWTAQASARLLRAASRRSGPTGIDLPYEPSGPDATTADWAKFLAADAPVAAVSDLGLDTVAALTPLQLALAGAAIANDGAAMWPHVVQRISVHTSGSSSDASGNNDSATGAAQNGEQIVELVEPRVLTRLLEPADARGLRNLMADTPPELADVAALTVDTGAGTEQVDASVVIGPVAGRFVAPITDPRFDPADDSRSASLPTGRWAMLLAPATEPVVVVAVIVEDDELPDLSQLDPTQAGGSTGAPGAASEDASGTVAVVIAAAVAETALALGAVSTHRSTDGR